MRRNERPACFEINPTFPQESAGFTRRTEVRSDGVRIHLTVTVRIKRVYDPPSPQDGVRVLVDRLWPRGLTKEAAVLDVWLKEVAPSDELRRWYHAHTLQWPKFRQSYRAELTSDPAHQALQQLHDLAAQSRGITLLFASKSLEHNHALILKQLLEGKRKPPTGTGPAPAVRRRARAARSR
jgi:uncharacterized protein YeaO (DUF488 family)